MKCLICNESSERPLCDDCSNKKRRTAIYWKQISKNIKIVKCKVHA